MLFFRLFLLFVLWVPVVGRAETVPETRTQMTLSFAPLVKQVAPAVVNIYARKWTRQRAAPLYNDPLFAPFFQGMERSRVENALGSGVIVRGDGLIVTSRHVIANADQIRVVLSDRREYDAVVLTEDEHSDLAILKLEAKGEKLPFLELKDSDTAQIGDLVLAIGNPFGVGRTVTSGIISAIAHRAVGSSDLDYFIQTDAAINPGNSGGALVTMDGKLVGINAAIYSKSGGNMGIGFAVPSNMVRVVLNAVEQGKKNIVRPWLGLDTQPVTAALAETLGMAEPVGVLVNDIHPVSPLVEEGLRVGDVIVAVDDHRIEDAEDFKYRIATLSVGLPSRFTVVRKGLNITLAATMIPPPETPPRDKTLITGNNPLAGATLVNLSPAVNEELGLEERAKGVAVSAVAAGSPAALVGLGKGRIVLGINDQPMNSVKDILATVRQPLRGWRITIRHGGSVETVMVE